MAGRGLITGIDYSDRYCQACYYNARHYRPESVSAGTDMRRYLIPSVLCYDTGKDEWVIGDAAVRLSSEENVRTFSRFMEHIKRSDTAEVNGREYSYVHLMAIFFSKLFEHIRIVTSVMNIDSVTVTMSNPDRDARDIFEQIFEMLKIPSESVKLLSPAECFGYFITNEPEQYWKDGALLFEFGQQGFFVKQMTVSAAGGKRTVNINEFDLSGDFSVGSLASEMLREQLDRKLFNLYNDLISESGSCSVFFTGDGFNDNWFSTTLQGISANHRAFRGSNIYVKGACLAGHRRYNSKPDEFLMLCPGRTRVSVSAAVWDKGRLKEMLLSPAAVNWYDAEFKGDFILEGERSIVFVVASAVSGRKTPVELELTDFGDRPVKATRAGLSVRYQSEKECVLTVVDKGFGDIYPDGTAEVTGSITTSDYE
ncbi:MAG: hypothetical protein HUJ76_08680 [Parasporobacterium sp.]|nr:hypothetical protein [Parasporobacterium sp.]